MKEATLSGHKNLNILKERYDNFTDETLQKAISILDGQTELRQETLESVVLNLYKISRPKWNRTPVSGVRDRSYFN